MNQPFIHTQSVNLPMNLLQKQEEVQEKSRNSFWIGNSFVNLFSFVWWRKSV